MSVVLESVVAFPNAGIEPDVVPERADGTASAVDAVICVVRELAEFIGSISDEQYTQKPVGPMKSSIGGHVRHCLDHILALLSAAQTGHLDYDVRERGTAIEHSRAAALELMREQERQFVELRSHVVDRLLRMEVVLSPQSPPLQTKTWLSRELTFVLSHTVHHNSLVAVAAALMGVAVPERFGYAPATLAWMDGKRCAR